MARMLLFNYQFCSQRSSLKEEETILSVFVCVCVCVCLCLSVCLSVQARAAVVTFEQVTNFHETYYGNVTTGLSIIP
jgi:hypothetical protein